MNDFVDLSGQHYLVTGGTRGIGKAISTALLARGAGVIANFARNQKAADAFRTESQSAPGELILCRGDLSRDTGIERVVAAAENVTLNGIIHAAATGIHKPLAELTTRHWDWVMGTNVRSLFELVSALRLQLAPGGSVVGLSSEGASRAVSNYLLVGASKGALESMIRQLAHELRADDVRCNVVSAGRVPTEAWAAFPDREEKLAALEQRMGGTAPLTAEEVASTVLFLCTPAASGINGATIVVDKGERIFPEV